MLFRSFEPSNLQLTLPASMLSICISSMLFTCSFEASNHPIFHSWPVRYLYVLPICYLQCHAISELRTTQSSIPGQYAIYTYCQYAIYMLFRSFKLSNLPFLASMLSICTTNMLFTMSCYFRASNHPIFHSWPVCYLYVLPVCFEPPNLPFPASMLSICITNMLVTCYFRASNHPIFHYRQVCDLYVLPVCYLHAGSNHPICQYATYTYCQYAIYMLFRSFEPPNLPFPASMLSICITSMLFTCCFEPPNLPVCYLYVLPVCYLHAASNYPMDGYILPVWQSVTKSPNVLHVHSTPASTLSPRNVHRQFLIATCTAFFSSNCQTFCTPVYGVYRGTGKL